MLYDNRQEEDLLGQLGVYLLEGLSEAFSSQSVVRVANFQIVWKYNVEFPCLG